MTKICLVMIVKDEAEILARCLASVLPVVDCAVIVDTGSQDKTKARALAELYEHEIVLNHVTSRPWVNFGHNRTEAFALAREHFPNATHHLVIDADDTLVCKNPTLARQEIAKVTHAMSVQINYNEMLYNRAQIFNARLPWTYKGVLHEYAHCETPGTVTHSTTMTMVVNRDGARAKDPARYAKDAEMLYADWCREQDPRTCFYLAQSYRDSGDTKNAAAFYRHRATMETGFFEERYLAMIELGLCLERMRQEPMLCVMHHVQAIQIYPKRPEAYYHAARVSRLCGHHHAALMFAKAGLSIAHYQGTLFASPHLMRWGFDDERALALLNTGNAREAKSIWKRILQTQKLATHERTRIVNNIAAATHPEAAAAVAAANKKAKDDPPASA